MKYFRRKTARCRVVARHRTAFSSSANWKTLACGARPAPESFYKRANEKAIFLRLDFFLGSGPLPLQKNVITFRSLDPGRYAIRLTLALGFPPQRFLSVLRNEARVLEGEQSTRLPGANRHATGDSWPTTFSDGSRAGQASLARLRGPRFANPNRAAESRSNPSIAITPLAITERESRRSSRFVRNNKSGWYQMPGAVDENEGVVKRHLFAAMLRNTAWISERCRTGALKLER